MIIIIEKKIQFLIIISMIKTLQLLVWKKEQLTKRKIIKNKIKNNNKNNIYKLFNTYYNKELLYLFI